MNFEYEIEVADTDYSDVEDWTKNIPGGEILELSDIIDYYSDEAEDIIMTTIEESGEDFSEEEVEAILEEDIEKIAEIIAGNLIDGIEQEIELMKDNLESPYNSFMNI